LRRAATEICAPQVSLCRIQKWSHCPERRATSPIAPQRGDAVEKLAVPLSPGERIVATAKMVAASTPIFLFFGFTFCFLFVGQMFPNGTEANILLLGKLHLAYILFSMGTFSE
jgi:hypothetical protein